MISSVVGPRRSSKALPKVKLAPKKLMVIALWSAARLTCYSFLNSGETITSEKYAHQIDVMHGKLQHLQLVNKKDPVLLRDSAEPHATRPTLQKLNELGYKVLPHLPYSPDLSPTDTTSSSISTTFCRENASITSRRQKMLSKSSLNPEVWIFML